MNAKRPAGERRGRAPDREERRQRPGPGTIDPGRKLGKAPRRGKVVQHQEVSMSTRLQPLVSLAVLAFAAGCDETLISVSSDGRIEVVRQHLDGIGFDHRRLQRDRRRRDRPLRHVRAGACVLDRPDPREPQRPAQRAGGELPGPNRVDVGSDGRATCRRWCERTAHGGPPCRSGARRPADAVVAWRGSGSPARRTLRYVAPYPIAAQLPRAVLVGSVAACVPAGGLGGSAGRPPRPRPRAPGWPRRRRRTR